MPMIMEQWRGFVDAETDLVKLDEEYKAFCKIYNEYCLLSESDQGAFLLNEQHAGYTRIVDFFKGIGEGVGTHWKKVITIFMSNDGLLWKVANLVGWSLDGLGKLLQGGFKTLTLLEDVIVDIAKDNPLTGKKGEEFTKWINKAFEDPRLGPVVKFMAGPAQIAGLLLVIYLATTIFGAGSPPFNASLILAALAGRWTARDLFKKNFFIQIIASIATGVALNMLFPGLGKFGGPVIQVLRTIIMAYKGGKAAAPKVKQVINKLTADEEEDTEQPQQQLAQAG